MSDRDVVALVRTIGLEHKVRVALARHRGVGNGASLGQDRGLPAAEGEAESAETSVPGNNKLVRPGLSATPDPTPEPRVGGGGGSGGGDSTMHPFVKGLVDELPAAGSDWADTDQEEWLEAAKAIFKLLYNKKNGAG
jgi:hypothetical protein